MISMLDDLVSDDSNSVFQDANPIMSSGVEDSVRLGTTANKQWINYTDEESFRMFTSMMNSHSPQV
jgi:hypothetical protein